MSSSQQAGTNLGPGVQDTGGTIQLGPMLIRKDARPKTVREDLDELQAKFDSLVEFLLLTGFELPTELMGD